jgi:hypothetical protein
MLVQWETLCTFHPAFALAILKGISVRPSNRVMQAQFSSVTAGQQKPAALDAIITSYSVFGGCDITIDPTNAFGGNPLAAQSAFFQTWGQTGILFSLQARTKGDNDYNPIPTDVPLQMVPAILNKTAGAWHFVNPDNLKGQFTLAATPPGGADAVPFTCWLTFSFLVLGPGGENYLAIPPMQARAMLAQELAALRAAAAVPSTTGAPGA